MTIVVHIWKDGKWSDTINMIDGDSCVIEAPGGIIDKGKNAVLRYRLKKALEANEYLRQRLQERDVRSIEGATVDELLDELKLRSEHFV